MNKMNIRKPYRAGSFYEEDPQRCEKMVRLMLNSAELPENLPQKIYGGIVPHAGWVYSGQVAAHTIKAVLSQPNPPQTLLLFGADHTGMVFQGEVYGSGQWASPLGNVDIDEELAKLLIEESDLFRNNPEAHEYEHSIEVQIPIVQLAGEDIKILPVAVPPTEFAHHLGKLAGKIIARSNKNVGIIGSTDLTHHGGHFGNPGGYGKEGIDYAVENDKRMIELIEKMKFEKVVDEAHKHSNACGAGAIAATMAACKELGATDGTCLKYTNSYEITKQLSPHSANDVTVGYASIIFS